MSPVRKIKRKYGLPYRGFTSSVQAHMCPKDYAWGAGNGSTTTSLNLLYDPNDGHFYPRQGTAYVGATTGLLEDVSGITEVWRARKMIALDSPSLTDGYPTHCVLFTDETNNVSALYLRSTNGSVDYQLGEEFSSNHYPGAAAGTMNIKCVPYYRTTSGTPSTSYGRLASATTRAYALAGSRGAQEGGDWVYFPCLDSIPMRWNRRYNDSSASGAENLRLMPTGAIPPLGYPDISDGTTAASGGWRVGNLFYYSVAYQYEDGSVSMPMIPRPTNSDSLPTGYLIKTVSNNCDFLTWSKIPVGPNGVIGRWLLRTPRREEGTSGVPSPLDLFVTAYIPNNTQTTYVDTNYSTLGLTDRPDIVRFDRILPPAARYIGNFDGRYIVGYTKPNPAAIVLAPMNPTAFVPSLTDYDDDNAALVADSYELAIDASTIKFYKNTVLEQTITFTGKSIQWVVDQIHRTTLSSNKWSAAILPGADGAADASSLAATTSVDTGDASGRIRSFAPSYPAIAYYGSAYLGQFPTEKRRWFFTQGGPGVQSNLADSWLAGNYRTGLASWGILQGFAPLLDGCLIFFSKAIVLFRNIKSGKSGLDDDYHPDDLFTNLGCIAWDSIAHGDGWAGCLTDRGYAVFDGTRGGVRIISGDVYNPATGDGEWAYEIAQCLAATGADTDGAHFHAKAMGGVLRCFYRSSAANTSTLNTPDRYIEYNFSLSSSGVGLDQVLRSDGTPWGWSAPCTIRGGVMGEVRVSTGIKRYTVVEPIPAQSFKEKILQLETAAVDPGDPATGITNAFYGPKDFAESLRKKQMQFARLVHAGTSAEMKLYLDRVTGNTQEGHGPITLPVTDGTAGRFFSTPIPFPYAARGPATAHQVRIVNEGLSTDTAGSGLAVWGMEAELVETSSYR